MVLITPIMRRMEVHRWCQKAFDKDLKVKDMKDVGVKKVDDKTFTVELIQPISVLTS